VVVANVEATDGGKALAAGNSRVLSARLDDARFFWDEDLKTGFEVWAKKLEGVTFHAKLGTLAERVERIAALAREIAPLVGADPDQAEAAAKLAKADLASGMVGEFPELQGVMGGYYARAFGHPDAVADAVRDHYKPQGPADSVPTAPLTVAVALADKLDTLVGFFAIDEKPTGSKDPFALRRAALGVIRLVLANEVQVQLNKLISSAFLGLRNRQFFDRARTGDVYVGSKKFAQAGLLGGHRLIERRNEPEISDLVETLLSMISGSTDLAGWRTSEGDWGQTYSVKFQGREIDHVNDTEHVVPVQFDLTVSPPIRLDYDPGALTAFFADRLKVLLRDQGKRHDLVDAVFALGDDDLVRIVRRVEALDAFLATDDGANLLAGYKRASNILKAEEKKGAVPSGMVQTGLPGQPEQESALAFAAAAAATAVDAALETEDFAAAMTALSRLRAPVDAFFDKVMVNSEVAAERENRLKLLGQVRAVMGRVADFGMVGG